MKFQALKNPGMVAHVKDPVMQFFPDGRERLIRPALVADFSEQSLGPESYAGYDDPLNGRDTYVAVRGGGYLDTEEAQKRHGWTDEERQTVDDHLTFLATTPPLGMEGDIKIYEKPVPVAPWPTYDSMHHNTVAETAKTLGLAAEALRYETQTKNRPAVTAKLQELVEDQIGEESLTAA